MVRVGLAIVAMIVSLLGAACSSGTATPTPTALPTSTPISTATPAPTPTPTLTLTPVSTTTPPPTPTGTATYTKYQLEYRLLASYTDIFWCDPDFYPISREGQEQANALQQFPTIKANAVEFAAILEHLALSGKPDYTDEEKLAIYRQHKLLTRAITVTSSGNIYDFSLRTGQNQGLRIEGTITPSGRIAVLKQEVSFNTCPICLSIGTLIDTPYGPVAVEQLQPGMTVWTVDTTGKRVAAPVIKASSTRVPASFQVVKVILNDGRSITASPGHHTADMRALGDYQLGDALDNGLVVSIEWIGYVGGATYDLLPSGGTGLYWANGILLMSTLAAN